MQVIFEFGLKIWNKRILNEEFGNFENVCLNKSKMSQMTELVLLCPRFTRNLTSRRAGRILCPPPIPTLTIHWPVTGLGDTGRHRPRLRVTHWAKSSRGQAAQLLDDQFTPF